MRKHELPFKVIEDLQTQLAAARERERKLREALETQAPFAHSCPKGDDETGENDCVGCLCDAALRDSPEVKPTNPYDLNQRPSPSPATLPEDE